MWEGGSCLSGTVVVCKVALRGVGGAEWHALLCWVLLFTCILRDGVAAIVEIQLKNGNGNVK